MDWNLIVGVVGMGLVLIAFVLNQTHKWSNDSRAYDLVNFLGSILLIVYAISLNSIPFILINTVWAAVSGWDLVKGIGHAH